MLYTRGERGVAKAVTCGAGFEETTSGYSCVGTHAVCLVEMELYMVCISLGMSISPST